MRLQRLVTDLLLEETGPGLLSVFPGPKNVSSTDLFTGFNSSFASSATFPVLSAGWDQDFAQFDHRSAVAITTSDSALVNVDLANFGFSAFGAPNGMPAAPRASVPVSTLTEILVQFEAGASAAQKANSVSSVGGRVLETVRAADGTQGDLLLISVPSIASANVISALGRNPVISFAEMNWSVAVQATANDPYYTNGNLWGMYGDTTSSKSVFGSQAGEAWATGYTGSSKVVVGVIDSGVDYTHPDLYLNIWLNQGELPTAMNLVDVDGDRLISFRDLNNINNSAFVSDLNKNGRIDAGDLLKDLRWVDGFDQDGNGFRDDLIGWDFVGNDNDPYDGNSHGTHVSGTIGAMGGNGTGVLGVSWDVQIMALKFLSDTGSGSTSGAIKAIDYYSAAAAADAAKNWSSEFVATNNSWGGGGYSQALLDSIVLGARQDVLFVAAAGNSALNNDSTANYPSNYSTLSAVGYEAVVAVAALTSSGALASYSNYGVKTVDLGAPGSDIWSTVPGGGYASYNGTSMAAPHVAGALALYAAANPELTASQLRDVLLASTTPTTSLANKTVTGGRLDANEMFGIASSPEPQPEPEPSTGVTKYGTTSGETVTGTQYGDILSGIPNSGTKLGKGTVDTLVGLGGNDIFLFGDARGRFYDDGNSRSSGTRDYGVIADWTKGDLIQLAKGNYFLSNTSVNGLTGVGIYHDTNGSSKLDVRDELIGLVQNISVSSLTSSDFLLV